MSESKYIKGMSADFDKEVEGVHRHIREQDYNLGWADCEQRIIKLLDEMAETAKSTRTKNGVTTFWAIENAKALIKGEKK